MTDIFDTLCALLPAQFEALIQRAEVPPEFLSPPNVAQATRATELVRWMKQKPAQRRRVESALKKVQGEPEPAPAHRLSSMRDAPTSAAEPPPAPHRAARTVLFLAAEPLDAVRLRLGKEQDTIRKRLTLAVERGQIVFESRWAVSPRDLGPTLLQVKPNVVHFSGHGSTRGCLCLEGEGGEAIEVGSEAIASVFRLVRDLECVVLNACYMEPQAEALSRCVPHVVGMPNETGDEAASAYSEGFYAALAEGRSIEDAHEAGCAQMRILGFHDASAPVLWTHGSRPGPEPSSSGDDARLHEWERDYLASRCEAWRHGRPGPLAVQGLEGGQAERYVPLCVVPQPWCYSDDTGRLVVRLDGDPGGEPTRRRRGPSDASVEVELAAGAGGLRPPLAEHAVTHRELRFVLIQGTGGSGKTVLLEHLAHVLASVHLERKPPEHTLDLEALRAGAPLLRIPVWIEARHIAEAAARQAPGALVRAVCEAFADVARIDEQTALGGLRAGRYLLLVDAVDEVPGEVGRHAVLEALAGLEARGWPCRAVLSARPREQTGARVPDTLRVLDLAPLDAPRIEHMVRRWCAARVYVDVERERLAEAIAGVRERYQAEAIVENPMLLASLFLVHEQERRQGLPESTATLYERMVTALCEAKPPALFTAESERRCTAADRREALEFVLGGVQRAGGTERVLSAVAEDLAEDWRPAELRTVDQAETFLRRLADETGLLRFEARRAASSRVEVVVRPWHRTFQEYLAACGLATHAKKATDVPAVTDALFEGAGDHPAAIDDPSWAGVLAFLVGAHGRLGRGSERARAYVARLIEHASGAREGRVLAFVATALVDYEQYFRGHALTRDVPGEIAARFEERGATWPWRDRVLALEALGRLGDPRLKRDPWVEIAGGVFVMGGDDAAWSAAPAHEVKVAAFRLSRWPVTVEEYREFVESSDYGEPRWWGGAPLRSEPDEWRVQLRHPNRPVVLVTWHEATAWCRWASKHRAPAGWYITLPTEEEWEYAARGEEGREFPWGRGEPGEEDAARANWSWGETWPGRPTPVGAFPLGHCGELWDMSGNVWEWTASPWREPETKVVEWPTTGCQEGDTDCREGDEGCRDDDKPCREGDTEEVAPRFQSEDEGESTSAAPRVLRGGSWDSSAGWLRCATRDWLVPARRSQSVGFRVVCRRFRQHVAIGP